jgi:bifunctional UDP-N-acetylglucosamine pyrophosphorylase/glucosamine-1-phosphate N-acetyltransferase
MVAWVIDALAEVSVERVVVVVGHGADRVSKAVQETNIADVALEFVEQRSQRGTGDAAAVGLTGLTGLPNSSLDSEDIDVVVLPGDTPLLRAPTLAALVREHRATDAAATVLTAQLDNPFGYGRLVRSRDGRVARIVEETDATAEERAITEVNTSIYCFRLSVLAPALRRLSPQNTQGEYYLTDAVAVLHDAGYRVGSLVAADPMEAAGVNDRAQLAVAEAELRDRINERWMRKGVTMVDPERTYVAGAVALAHDVTLFPGTILQGTTRVDTGAIIGPDSQLIDCSVGSGAVIEHSIARQAVIAEGAHVGPFSVLEPGAHVGAHQRVEPFEHLSAEGA